ncbi:MAG: DUF1501 domain-containing protein [Chloroflexaceae bacterium]|jgi:uncharacterized protein (DUF1501 family)|nr:DUF1501 domain-containing protein [Chloroflexaceae bacterium]
MTLSRREFLVGCSAAIAALAGSRVTNLVFANPADTTARDILVVVFLRGGCDGLNLVAPTGDRNYADARPVVRVPNSGSGAGISINNAIAPVDFRLHPRAASLKELYDSRNLAIVHACGLTNDTRSHFDAMDYMEAGLNDDKNSNGWLVRHLNSISASGIMPAVSALGSVPKSLRGSSQALSINDVNNFRLQGNSTTYTNQQQEALRAMYAAAGSPIHQVGLSTLDAINTVNSKIARDSQNRPLPYTPEAGAVYPTQYGTSLGNALRIVAQLIKMDVGLQVATVDYGGWDTHGDQNRFFGNLVEGLALAMHAFYNDMNRYASRLTVAVVSEFGRRLKENQSAGTDHGHGNVMFVMGGYVNGGKMYGSWPGLATEQLDNRVDLAITTDYRAVLAEILSQRLANPNVAEVFPRFSVPAQPLDIVRATNGQPNPPARPMQPAPAPGNSRIFLPLVRR